MCESVCVVYDLDGMVLVTIYFFKIMFCASPNTFFETFHGWIIWKFGVNLPPNKVFNYDERVFVKLKVKFE